MINMILDDTNERMTKTIESFQRDLSSVRTGRTNRNIRRDSNDEIKKTDGSEDEIKAGQERVQKLTDKFVKEIDEIAKVKEKDIMTV